MDASLHDGHYMQKQTCKPAVGCCSFSTSVPFPLLFLNRNCEASIKKTLPRSGDVTKDKAASAAYEPGILGGLELQPPSSISRRRRNDDKKLGRHGVAGCCCCCQPPRMRILSAGVGRVRSTGIVVAGPAALNRPMPLQNWKITSFCVRITAQSWGKRRQRHATQSTNWFWKKENSPNAAIEGLNTADVYV